MKLLVAIAAHYATERVRYLEAVLNELSTYQCQVDIIIDTNDYMMPVFEVTHTRAIHQNLAHPFHLTQMHRQHFKREIDHYDWFMYLEDDMLVKWETFLAYTDKFPKMWPKYVPSFIRIEEKDGEEFISDVTEQHSPNLVWIDTQPYFSLPFPQHYHAFWISPAYALKETMDLNFTKLHDSRESAASYFLWEKKKKGLLTIVNEGNKFQIGEDCFSYHLPSNYIDSNMLNAKIKLKEIFI